MKSIDQVVKNVCTKKGVRCVSFRELADWLDVQKPATLERLRSLDPCAIPGLVDGGEVAVNGTPTFGASTYRFLKGSHLDVHEISPGSPQLRRTCKDSLPGI